MPDFNAFSESFFSDRRQEEEPMVWEGAPFLPEEYGLFLQVILKTGRSACLHTWGCPEGLTKRAASRDQSSRPPRGVPWATLCIEQITAADGLLS
ncbi:hypothetical protein TNCV_3660081 [Trichonephila clavipes]|nr:hypothetical protein TNCV_3660081 [Trichonephila clavipes]